MSASASPEAGQRHDQFVRWLEPNRGEFDSEIVDVDGEIPREIFGTWVGNGPSQQQIPPEGVQAMHFFDGDAYLRAVRFEAGTARLTTRFVRTPSFIAEQVEGRFCMTSFGLVADDKIEAARVEPNTHVIHHASRLFALVENAPPFEVDPHSFEAIGSYDYDGRLIGMSTSAHPRVDPETGRLFIHGYQPIPPFLSLYCIEPDGEVSLAEAFDAPWASMMHDMAITQRHVVLPLGPVRFELGPIMAGEAFGAALRHDPDLPLQFGIRANAPGSPIRWFEAPTHGFVFHTSNAYEKDGLVHLDAAVFFDVPGALSDLARLRSASMDAGLAAVPVHYEFDPLDGSCREYRRSDEAMELPRINEAYTGRENRYSYALASRPNPVSVPDGTFTALVKHDWRTERHALHAMPPAHWTGEPVFIPRESASSEDDGFVFSAIYDGANDRSGFQILDAAHFEAPPLARLWVEERIPLGFHGRFVPGLV